jgi:hypothetical protein
VEALSNRVRRICEDLAVIEKQLDSTAEPHPDVIPAADILAQDMKTLKEAIDETRAFLWSYFQRTAAEGPARPPEPVPVQEAAPRNVGLPQAEPIDSFFEEIENLATRIVEKHMPPKPETTKAD